MNISLNEVESAAKKATRGAGYSWGMAEEAGKAARWMCRQDLDGCAILADLLVQTDGRDLSDWSPKPDAPGWNAAGGTLCPIMTGAALSDHAGLLKAQAIEIANVVQPLLLLPFVAMAARRLNNTLTVTWSGNVANTNGSRLVLKVENFGPAELVKVELGEPGGVHRIAASRAFPDPDAWATLNRFAHRTYAPATAESRAKGAGAGETDAE